MKKTFLAMSFCGLILISCEKDSKSEIVSEKNHKSTEEIVEWTQEGSGTYYLNDTNTESIFPGRKFDLYSPASEEPVPLIIAFHLGGFTHGHRSLMYPWKFSFDLGFPWISIANLDNRKIAYAAVSYALVSDVNGRNIMTSLNDCKSYVDFFSNPVNAAKYNVDPTRIILMGRSAGASASLWIGLQNIYPNIKGLVCFDPQASLDLDLWETTIFHGNQDLKDYCRDQMTKNNIPDLHNWLYRNPLNASDRTSLHLLDLIDPTDPEVYLVSYNQSSYIEPDGDFLHHDRHIHRLITKSITNGHNKMKFMYDNSTAYFGYKYPNPETVINFCDRLF